MLTPAEVAERQVIHSAKSAKEQMIRIFACSFMLLPIPVWAANLVIPTEPYRVEMESVRRYQVAYGFGQDASGRFHLQVHLRYRNTSSKLERFKKFTFQLQQGTIMQRDKKTLILRLKYREFLVGGHRWWYSPYWQTLNDVQIACDHYRRFTSVVIENCRLILNP